MKSCLDQGLVNGVSVTDFLKASDCVSHDLLAVKLNEYGLETTVMHLVFDYLTNRKQQTKIDCHSNSEKKPFFEVPHGSILGPLLF